MKDDLTKKRVGIALGLVKVFFGLLCFFVGLRLGLLPMGRAGGSRMVRGMMEGASGTQSQAAQTPTPGAAPAYSWAGLIGVSCFSLFTIGLAQLIEPSLNILGRE